MQIQEYPFWSWWGKREEPPLRRWTTLSNGDIAILKQAGVRFVGQAPQFGDVCEALTKLGLAPLLIRDLRWADIVDVLCPRKPNEGLRLCDASRVSGVNEGTIQRAYRNGLIAGTGKGRATRLDDASFNAWLSRRASRPARKESDAAVERKFRQEPHE